MQLWKIPVKSARQDFIEDPEKVQRARRFCFEQGWIGIGWGIATLTDEATPSIYKEKAKYEYADGLRPALSAHNSFSCKMVEGDFVWCRENVDTYWIGKVTGPWIYQPLNFEHDLFQVRTCSWRCVGSSDKVPGPVKNAFVGRGPAICRIHDAFSRRSTVSIWNNLSGENIVDVDGNAKLTLSQIAHDDLEDLILLYIQSELGWFVVTSTVKHSTPSTECVLINADGKKAHVQVKSGKTAIIQANVKVPEDIDTFFLFDLVTKDMSCGTNKIVRISTEQFVIFLKKNRDFLPFHLSSLEI